MSLTAGELGVLVLAAAMPTELAAAARRLTLGVDLEQVDRLRPVDGVPLRVDSSLRPCWPASTARPWSCPRPLEIRVVPGALRVVVPVGTLGATGPTESAAVVQALGSLLEIAGGVDRVPSATTLSRQLSARQLVDQRVDDRPMGGVGAASIDSIVQNASVP